MGSCETSARVFIEVSGDCVWYPFVWFLSSHADVEVSSFSFWENFRCDLGMKYLCSRLSMRRLGGSFNSCVAVLSQSTHSVGWSAWHWCQLSSRKQNPEVEIQFG